jgi:hypothetical protein
MCPSWFASRGRFSGRVRRGGSGFGGMFLLPLQQIDVSTLELTHIGIRSFPV